MSRPTQLGQPAGRIGATPTRHHRLTLCVLAALTFVSFMMRSGTSAGEQQPFPRPNFIVILTDDQRWDTLQFMPHVRERLVQHGITFRNSFVTTALCCPSRASLLTGQYPHNHGVLNIRPPKGGVEAFDPSSTLATWLTDAGYETALVGKYLNRYDVTNQNIDFATVPPGWSRWFAYSGFYYDYSINDNGTVRHFGTNPEDYSTDVFRDVAVDFVQQADKPFFLLFTPYAPHGSDKWNGGDPTPIPAPADEALCPHQELPRPPSLNPNLSDEDAESLRRWRERAICSLTGVDRAVDAILSAIPVDEYDNTVVLFSSDNGFAYGEHGRKNGKSCQYEECLRVPLIVSYPGLITAPRTEPRMVLNIDYAPTIAELAGIEPENVRIDGTSFVPLLTHRKVPWRKDFLFENYYPAADVMTYGVRSARYKYVDRVFQPDELYDLRFDRYEVTNVFKDRLYRQERLAMQARLQELLVETGAKD